MSALCSGSDTTLDWLTDTQCPSDRLIYFLIFAGTRHWLDPVPFVSVNEGMNAFWHARLLAFESDRLLKMYSVHVSERCLFPCSVPPLLFRPSPPRCLCFITLLTCSRVFKDLERKSCGFIYSFPYLSNKCKLSWYRKGNIQIDCVFCKAPCPHLNRY